MANRFRNNKLAQMLDSQKIYEVFARKNHEEPLMHVGSVNASNDELARVYAWTAYDEEKWVEMCVVRRHEVIPVLNPEEKPIWGN
jgi:1,2-phenylacetyl-CoA epoxidase PaaB subunit